MSTEKRIHTTTQRIIQPMTIILKLQIHERSVCELNVCAFMSSSRTRKSARDVPSLKRLSPSKRRRSLFGTHISLKIARTATGSVDEMIIPKSSIRTRGMSNPINERSHRHPTQIVTVEIRTPKIASVRIVT